MSRRGRRSAGSISATQLISQLPRPTISASPNTDRTLAAARALSMLKRAMMMHSEPHSPSTSETRVYVPLSLRLSTICDAAKKPPIALTVAMNRRLTRCARAAMKVATTKNRAASTYAAVRQPVGGQHNDDQRQCIADSNCPPSKGGKRPLHTPPVPTSRPGRRVSTPRPKRLVRLHELAKLHKGWFSPREQSPDP